MMVRISEYKNACKIHISKAKKNPSKSGEQFLEEENVSQVQDGLNVPGSHQKSSKSSGPSE